MHGGAHVLTNFFLRKKIHSSLTTECFNNQPLTKAQENICIPITNKRYTQSSSESRLSFVVETAVPLCLQPSPCYRYTRSRRMRILTQYSNWQDSVNISYHAFYLVNLPEILHFQLENDSLRNNIKCCLPCPCTHDLS